MNESERNIQKHPEVTREMRRKAEVIAMFMGGDYNMTVGVGPWGSGWHWDFVKNHVNMDAKDLATESEDVVKGVAAHEGNHRLVSRAEHVMDMWQEPGFAFGFNAVEDPRANEGGMHFRPGIKDWMQAYIERDLGPDGGLDYEGIEKKATNKLGYVPDFMKWGAEMIRYWHGKKISGEIVTEEDRQKFLDRIPDKDVKETVGKTLDFFEEYYKTLPDTKDEMEVQRKAREGAQNFKDNIWPEYKKLVEKSYDDHSLVKMLQDMLDQQAGEGQESQDQSGTSNMIEIPFSFLPKDIQEEIKKKIQEAQKDKKQKGQGGPGGQENEGDESQSDQQDGQSGQGGEEQGEGQGGSFSDSESSETSGSNQEGQGRDSSQSGEESKNGSSKIPWDQLSDEAKEAVKKAFGQLPEEKQQEYKEQAEEELKDAEDEANENLRGKMNDPRYIKTHREQEAEAAAEEEQDNNAQNTQQMIGQMDRAVREAKESIPENPYNHYLTLPEVDGIRRRMERDFKKLFEPTENPDVRYTSVGLRPSMKKAMQMEADPRRGNIFEAKGRPLEKSYRFLILVDLSGSMSDKVEEMFKTLVPFAEVMNRFGIEFAIVGYTDSFHGTVKVYKDFETQKLTKQSRDKMGGIMNDEEMGGGTPTKEATEISVKMLKKRMGQKQIDHNYFITLTDGGPTDCSRDDLLKQINNIRKDRNIVTAGYGIGPGTQFVNESYPKLPDEVKNAVARDLGRNPMDVGSDFANAVEFGRAFAIIVGYMVKRPELFFK